MKKKYAIILYSGGKDSHYTVYYAIKNNYEPILIYVNGGKYHIKLFNNLSLLKIIKQHIKLMNIKKYYEYKINQIIKIDKLPQKIFSFLINKLKTQKIKLNEVFFFFSFDYNETSRDKKHNNIIKNLLKKNKIKYFSFKKIIKKDSFISPINLCKKAKIKSIIISVEKVENKVVQKFLGKEINEDFIKYIKTNNLDANDYQTLVLESPLFKGYRFKILTSKISTFPKTNFTFLKIKKWKIEKIK